MILFEIRKYILKHVQNLNNTLIDVKKSKKIIHENKSQFCMNEIKILTYFCDFNGRNSKQNKIQKIVDWPAFNNIIEIRIFSKICVYYWIWIKKICDHCSIHLYFFRKNIEWHWPARNHLYVVLATNLLFIKKTNDSINNHRQFITNAVFFDHFCPVESIQMSREN